MDPRHAYHNFQHPLVPPKGKQGRPASRNAKRAFQRKVARHQRFLQIVRIRNSPEREAAFHRDFPDLVAKLERKQLQSRRVPRKKKRKK